MLLSGFLKIIKKAFDGFVSLLAFLLFKAGLWLPAAFTLLFIVICAICKASIAGALLVVFIIGLIASALIGVALAARRYIKLKMAVPSKKKVRYMEKTGRKENIEPDYRSEWDNGGGKRYVADEDRLSKKNGYEYKEPDIAVNNPNKEEPRRQSVSGSYSDGYNPHPPQKPANSGFKQMPEEETERTPFSGYAGYNDPPPQNKGTYEDFAKLKREYFGNADPYAETAAHKNEEFKDASFEPYNRRQNNTDRRDDLSNYYQDGFGQSGYTQNDYAQNSYGQNNQSQNNYGQNDYGQNNGQNNYGQNNGQNNYAQNEPPARQKERETPMVFATRRDPDIIIYEYSDRLVFYRKSSKGLMLIAVEPKN